ncbi:MAG: SCO family protein [Acidobacteriota bacterium]
MSRVLAALLSGLLCLSAACQRTPPAKRYELKGQILAVVPDKQELTLKHEDIVGFMPAMTMNYQVASAALLKDREPGELITGTLEVRDSDFRITSITHTGTAPIAATPNHTALTALLAEGEDVPDTALIDQQDRRRSTSEWKGSLTLVTFIYTTCPQPNFCPLMDQNFATIQRSLAEDPALKGQVKLMSVSFDPDHDTPAVLAAHAKKLKADPAVWTFLTGDKVTIERFAGRFGIGIVPADTPGQLVHNLRTALIGRDGKVIKFYTGSDWTPGTALGDLRAAAQRP